MPEEKKEKTLEQRVADLERTADAAVTIAKKIAAALFKQFGIKILAFAVCAFAAMPVLAVDTLFNPVGPVYSAGTFKVIAESQSSTVTCKTDVVVATTVQCTTLNATTISGAGNQVVTGTATVNGNTTLGGTLGVSNTVTLTTNLVVSGTTQSTGLGSGSIVASGGASVAKNAAIGGTLTANGNTTLGGTLGVSNAVTVTTNLTVNGTDQSTGLGAGAVVTLGGASVAKNATVGGTLTANGNTTLGGTLGVSNAVTITTNLTVNGTDQSTGLGSGAIVTLGGASVAKNATIGGTLTANGNTVLGGTATVTGLTTVAALSTTGNINGLSLTLSGDATVNGTTESTSKDTGAIVTEGGLGVEKNAYIGGALRVNGKGVDVSTNATLRMTCSMIVTNTSAAQTITLPIPFAGGTVPVAVAGWQEALPAPAAGTNWAISASAVSNTVTITSTFAPPGGAATNISVIVHGVAP